jgi:hypothetical protein
MEERRFLALEAGLLSLALFLSAVFAPGTLIASGVVVFCLLYASHRLAPLCLPRHTPWPRLGIFLAAFLGFQSILQTGFYYLGVRLNTWTDAGTEMVTMLVFYAIALFKQDSQAQLSSNEIDPSFVSQTLRFFAWIKHQHPRIVAVLTALISSGFILTYVQRLATTEAIRTPWAILPQGILLAFACLFGAGWLAGWRGRSTHLTWILVSVFFGVVALFAPLFYPLGFGFDGFLHRASETILFQTGSLQPKPFYYIGQYTFVTWLARTLTLSVREVDLFLLVGSMVLLPATLALQTGPGADRRKKVGMWLVGLALFLPLKPWIIAKTHSARNRIICHTFHHQYIHIF